MFSNVIALFQIWFKHNYIIYQHEYKHYLLEIGYKNTSTRYLNILQEYKYYRLGKYFYILICIYLHIFT